jgi:hypothetical protein
MALGIPSTEETSYIMNNIFTHSITPPFTKQSLTEFFVDPMFMGQDIRGAITVRTDIKGTEKLNRISRPSMITKPKLVPGFTPNGSFELSTQDITVKPMAIEFEQNGREFWGTVAEQLLASGYKEDDIEQMKSPDIWNKIILPIIAQAGQQDLIRQMWFADSASADENYNGYDGFFKNFSLGLASGAIEANKNISFGTPAVGAHTEIKVTQTANLSSLHVIINDVDYSFQSVTTNIPSHVAAWVGEHAATLLALNITAIVPEDQTDTIYLDAKIGNPMSVTATLTPTGAVSLQNVISGSAASLATDEVDNTLDEMINVMNPEMLEFKPVFQMSRSAYRNLFHTWKSLGTETANKIRFKGVEVPVVENIPILIHPDWDIWDKTLGTGSPGRVVLSPQKNLLFATDGSTDSEMIETWYNQEEQMRRYRVQYKAQTAYLHNELLVLAGMV